MTTLDLFEDNILLYSNAAIPDTFLRRTFFIYDKTACKNEEDPPEDMIVFFYPTEVPLESQMFIIGSCSSMIEFAKNFTHSTPKVLAMDRHKMAIIEVGVLTLVLSAPASYPDSALQKDLEHVYGAFRFFFGSFDLIMKNTDGERQQFLDIMKELGKEIVPFIRRYESQPFSSFDPLPYTALPPNSNRFFLMTSEVLTSVKSENDNLGGCVMYNDSVLCSHLEPTTTFYILTRLESMYGSNKVTVDPKSPSPSEVMAVFLPHQELNQLREGRAPVIEASDDLRSQLPEGYFTPTETGEFVGLFLLFFSKLAMAVLMNLPAMYDERHISKTRALVHAKLFALESKLFKGAKSVQTNADRSTLPFNFLSYDRVTQLVTASSLEQNETDQRFRFGTKTVHEIFTAQPNVNCVMLKDHAGPMFARRFFERETFYQQKIAPQTPSPVPTKIPLVPKEFSRLEENARENLQDVNVPFF